MLVQWSLSPPQGQCPLQPQKAVILPRCQGKAEMPPGDLGCQLSPHRHLSRKTLVITFPQNGKHQWLSLSPAPRPTAGLLSMAWKGFYVKVAMQIEDPETTKAPFPLCHCELVTATCELDPMLPPLCWLASSKCWPGGRSEHWGTRW